MTKEQLQKMTPEDYVKMFSKEYRDSIDWSPTMHYNVDIYDLIMMISFMGDI